MDNGGLASAEPRKPARNGEILTMQKMKADDGWMEGSAAGPETIVAVLLLCEQIKLN